MRAKSHLNSPALLRAQSKIIRVEAPNARVLRVPENRMERQDGAVPLQAEGDEIEDSNKSPAQSAGCRGK
jgi:hypothetical protein